MSENNVSTEIEIKVDKLYKSIDEAISNKDFQKAYEIARENKTYLTQYSNVKQQLLLNKYNLIILYEITLSAYTLDKDYNKFVELFEQNRNFFEVHLEKPKYNKLLRYDTNIKKAIRKKKMKFIIPVLGVAILLAGFAIFSLNVIPKFPSKGVPSAQTDNKFPLDAPSTGEEPLDSVPSVIPNTQNPEVVEPEAPAIDPSDSNSMDQGFILASDTKVLTLDDIDGMDVKELRLAINEMYARHGYYFGPGINQRYFDSKPWYNADKNIKNPNDIIANFTKIENNNLTFLANQERLLKNN